MVATIVNDSQLPECPLTGTPTTRANFPNRSGPQPPNPHNEKYNKNENNLHAMKQNL